MMRFRSTQDKCKNSTSLEDYLKQMKEGQKKIYYITSMSPDTVMTNPFMDIFKDSKVPVLVI